MKIKSAKRTDQVNPLPKQERWHDKICERFFATVDEPCPRFFGPGEEFHRGLFEQDIFYATEKKYVKPNKLPGYVKAVRDCFDQYGITTFRTVFGALARTFDGNPGLIMGAESKRIATPDGPGDSCGFQVNYVHPQLDKLVLIADTYYYVGGTGEPDNSVFEELSQKYQFQVVAKDPGHQPLVDTLEAIVRKIADDSKMVLVTLPTGELNYPAIQALSEVSTPYGLCIHKMSVSFTHAPVELRSVVPSETPVLPFIKKD